VRLRICVRKTNVSFQINVNNVLFRMRTRLAMIQKVQTRTVQNVLLVITSIPMYVKLALLVQKMKCKILYRVVIRRVRLFCVRLMNMSPFIPAHRVPLVTITPLTITHRVMTQSVVNVQKIIMSLPTTAKNVPLV